MSPLTLYKEDGTEVQVPTEEELNASIEQKVGETKVEYENRLKEMEGQVNPNWAAAREKLKRLEALEAKQKEINELGEVVDKTPTYDPNELDKKIAETVSRSTFTIEKTRALAQFGEKAEVVGHYLDKLMTGEAQTIDNLYKFVSEAARLAAPEVKPTAPIFSGMPPVREEVKDDFADNPAGQELAARMGLITKKQ